ncbi:hypothetical protein [Mycolicibacterium llatzerense]|uniref:hypothetical protein n=1 Tax=Mycolicibacterium llatzerense TaxID=280871 RepID=UPI0021B666D8|nr:hypothetical protein [Mycolicibacterium llatzerense]
MSLGPYFSPFFDVPELDDRQRVADDAMRRLHTVISEAMDHEIAECQKGEKWRRRIEFVAKVALAVFVIVILLAIVAGISGVIA